MHLDVTELGAFYGSPLGQAATRALRRPLKGLWSDVRGLRIAGIGYPQPYLLPFRQDAERVFCLMPAAQGCHRWPQNGPQCVALVEEDRLPLPDASIDRLLVVHALETSEMVRPLLREIWRVLTDHGRVAVIVPSRVSLWARLERTPFGHGHPFTRGQIARLLGDCLFRPVSFAHGLHMPPFAIRAFVASSGAWEEAGRRLWPQFAGVHIVEATKELYAGAPAAKRRLRLAPVGAVARPVRARTAETPLLLRASSRSGFPE